MLEVHSHHLTVSFCDGEVGEMQRLQFFHQSNHVKLQCYKSTALPLINWEILQLHRHCAAINKIQYFFNLYFLT